MTAAVEILFSLKHFDRRIDDHTIYFPFLSFHLKLNFHAAILRLVRISISVQIYSLSICLIPSCNNVCKKTHPNAN